MKRGIIILIILILIIPTVLSQTAEEVSEFIKNNPEMTEKMIKEQIEGIQKELNNKEIPRILRNLAGRERVNIITDDITIGFQMVNLNIKEIQVGAIEKSTLDIFIPNQAIEEISSGQKDLLTAIEDKTITYKAKKLRTKIKMRFIKTFLKSYKER